jgi:lysophospholipase L1-like esterase
LVSPVGAATVVGTQAIVGGGTVTGSAAANDVAIIDNYAYLVTDQNSVGPELSIFDITTPSSPKLVGRLNITASVRKIVVQGTTAYLATSDSTRELLIVNVRTKNAPAVIGSFNAPGASSVSGAAVAAVGSTIYLATTENAAGPELYVLNTAATPVAVLGTFEVGGRTFDLDVVGARAYLGTSRSARELLVVNVANPAQITQTAEYDLPGANTARGLDYHGGLLVAVAPDGGVRHDLFVFSAPLEGTLALLSSLNLAANNTDVALYGGAAFVAQQGASQYFGVLGGLAVVDLTTPTAPKVARRSGIEWPSTSVAVKDSLAYLGTTTAFRKLQVVSSINLEPTVKDINGDGLKTVVCIGDSNTNPPEPYRPGWCEKADALVADPTWRFINRAVHATTAVRIDGTQDGYTQITESLAADKPDVFVLNHGTNDAQYGWIAPDILQALLDLKAIAEQAGVPVFGSLVAARYDDVSINDVVQQLNNLLRNEWPLPRLIDFASSMLFPEDYLSNKLELGPTAQDKRARIAVKELRAPTIGAASVSAAVIEPQMSTSASTEPAMSAQGLFGGWAPRPAPLAKKPPATSPETSKLRDINGDGKIIVACLGDSNTEANFGGIRSWCERFKDLMAHKQRSTVNRGKAATTVVKIAGTSDGYVQVQEAINSKADCVIAAFGTNGVRYGYSPRAIVAAYRDMKRTLDWKQIPLYVATTPRMYDDPDAYNATVYSLNISVKNEFADHVIDFAGAVTFPADYRSDRIHMNDSGQSRRAAVAWSALQ